MTEEQLQCNESWLTKGSVLLNATETSHSGDDFVRTLGISIGIFDICLGSTGNFLTMFAIWRNRRLRSTFHSFIVSLCFVDFCTASFMMPFNVASYATADWPFGKEDITCSIQAFVYYCCGYSSVVCLVVITTNRYIGVLYPDKYEEIFTPMVVYFTIALSLAFAPIVMGVFFFLGKNGEPGYGWIDMYSLCVFRTDKDNQVIRGYMQFTRILFQCVPLVIMMLMYGKIFYTVWKSGRDVAKLSLQSAEPRRGSLNSSTDRDDAPVLPSCVTATQRLDDSPGTSEPSLAEEPPTAATLAIPKNQISKGYHSEGSDVSDNEHVSPRPILKNFPHSSCSDLTIQNQCNVATLHNHTKFTRNKPHNRSFSVNRKNQDIRIHRGFSIRSRLSKRSVGSTRSRSSMIDNIRRRRKTDRRLLSISVTICMIFSIIFYPSVLVNLFPCSKYFNPNVHKCASIITWFNSCVNPVIYCFMNPKLRAEYKLILRSFGQNFMRLIGKGRKPDEWHRAISNNRR